MFIVVISRGMRKIEIMVCMDVVVGVIIFSFGILDVLRYTRRCWGDQVYLTWKHPLLFLNLSANCSQMYGCVYKTCLHVFRMDECVLNLYEGTVCVYVSLLNS